ncbi:hypothetical protein BV25DRAFT_1918075 [Artomyces pyxidatus]|uniref:Uncharacterized protein n=1 Tax=Artomyces pyxidatus TaxID=48021 RepID=A0ACB8SUR1_9AGAM|nr:hypothetical protein BV25DRAFT_1918075 [Artomyces pyxidatus]
MPTKKSHLTRKKGRKGIPDAEQEGALPPHEWKKLQDLQYCTVVDGRRKHKFRKGETVLVLGFGMNPDEIHELHTYWVGKIKAIKGKSHESEAWVNVQWYYSGEDIAEQTTNIDVSGYGRFERSLSQAHDWVHFQTLDVVTVIRYNEDSISPEAIQPTDFYCRRSFDPRKNTVDPPIASTSTCICGQPYNPDKAYPLHFCPRPKCRKWYHRLCLIKEASIDDVPREGSRRKHDTTAHHRYKLLCSSPDHQQTLDLKNLTSGPRGPTQKKVQFNINLATLENVPTSLKKIAQQQIMKGGATYGVVGNVKDVVDARRFVYRLLQVETTEEWDEVLGDMEEWLEQHDVSHLLSNGDSRSSADGDDNHEAGCLALICPICRGAI